jgi:four helix bundle protein
LQVGRLASIAASAYLFAASANSLETSTGIRDAARGGTRNIAEGYSRFIPAEILRFLSIAKASLDETGDQLLDGLESGYWTRAEYNVARSLLRRTHGAIRGCGSTSNPRPPAASTKNTAPASNARATSVCGADQKTRKPGRGAVQTRRTGRT